MLNRSTTWAVVFLAATFAAGIAVGAGGRALWVRYASAAAPERGRGLDRMMEELNNELSLSPAQRDSVRAIVQRHRTRMTAVWETVRPASADERAAWGAYLPTITTSGSASRSNAAGVDLSTGRPILIPGEYRYSVGLAANLDLFTGFKRGATRRAASARTDAANAGFVNQRYQVSAATAQVFYTSLANEEL